MMSGDYINRYAVLNTIDDAIAHNALSYEGCVNEIMEFIAKLLLRFRQWLLCLKQRRASDAESI